MSSRWCGYSWTHTRSATVTAPPSAGPYCCVQSTALRKAIVLTGDLNLDVTRRHDSGYRCKAMLADLKDAAAAAGFEYHATTHTFRSYGMHSDGGALYAHCYSTIDHTYMAGVVASVEVLADSSSDHRPLVTVVNAGAVRDPEELATIQRRNFKRLERHVLEAALLSIDLGSKLAIKST
jgi:hypothetical protein